jgi:hypothetical protein
MSQLYAQGDLLIERVRDLEPSGKIIAPPKDNITVLAEGEVTGHRHAIHQHVVMFRDDNLARDMPHQLYVGHIKVADGPVHLNHEEHDAITLSEGTYRVRRQRQAEPHDVEIVKD